MIAKCREIYEYREMIFRLIRRELRGRYKGSFLGFTWNFINPLCQIMVYYMIFTMLFNNDMKNYHIFLMTGMFTWNFFADSLNQGSGCIMNNSDMTKKIYFPRQVLPISIVSSAFVNLMLTYVVLFVLTLIARMPLNIFLLLYVPVIVLVEYALALGFALLLSCINVYFRDVQYMTGVVLMAWVWLSPIMYSVDTVTSVLKYIVQYNPMTGIIVSLQNVIYYQTEPEFDKLAYSAMFALVILIIGNVVFSVLEKEFAGEL